MNASRPGGRRNSNQIKSNDNVAHTSSPAVHPQAVGGPEGKKKNCGFVSDEPGERREQKPASTGKQHTEAKALCVVPRDDARRLVAQHRRQLVLISADRIK